MTRWGEGDHIVLRGVLRGRVWSAKPVIVVRDGPELVALYLMPGVRWKQPRSRGGGRVGVIDIVAESWALFDAVWTGGGALLLHEPGAGHALVAFYEERPGVLRGWYLNLQEPLRRTAIGFDFLDQMLDIVVSADRQSWSWKDEDELADAQIHGLVDAETATAIRAEGERALALLLAGAPPYAVEWETWIRDPGWAVPKLPAGWVEVSE